MAKSKRNQDPSKPLSSLQTAHSYSINDSTTPKSAATSAPGEEAGVCVVCEDECTCGAAAAAKASSNAAAAAAAALAASAATASSAQPTSNKKRLILKVSKPVVGSFEHSHATITAPHFFDSTSPNARIISAAPALPVNNKKRARGTKPDLSARQAAARAAHHRMSQSQPAARRTAAGGLSATNKPQKRSTPAHLSGRSIASEFTSLPTTTTLPTFVPASIFGSDSSSLSSPSSDDDSSESDSSSSSDDDDVDADDTDSELEAEEEHMIVQEETLARQKARTRRELEKNARENGGDGSGGGGGGGRKRWDKSHWTNREPRHGSVGADDTMVSDDDSSSAADGDSGSSGDDEQEDGEGDEDDDLELDGMAVVASGLNGNGPVYNNPWSDDEDHFDADVFFANLSDSSFDSSSSDSETEGPGATSRHAPGGTTTNGDDAAHAMSLVNAVEAGLVAGLDQPLPLVVTEDWDGQLVFAHGLQDADEMMDLIFGAALLDSDVILTTSEPDSMQEADETDDDAGTDRPHEDDDDDEDYEEIEEDETIDEGETTDEDELHPELGPIAFASVAFAGPVTTPSIFSSSKPDPLALSIRRRRQDSTASTLTTTSRGSGSQISESGRLIPVMGSFTITDASMPLSPSSAVIDGSRASVIPSPYSRTHKRKKRRPVLQIESTLRTPKRVRPSSRTTPTPTSPTPALSRSLPNISEISIPFSLDAFSTSAHGNGNTSETGNSTEAAGPSTPTATRVPLPIPIDLDDVFHLQDDDELSDDEVATSLTVTTPKPHQRWDRIPFNAFHRLRNAVHNGVLGSPVNHTVTMAAATATSPTHSYGVGGVEYSSPIIGVQSSPTRPTYSPKTTTPATNKRRGRAASLASKPRQFLVSPVLLPTSTDDSAHHDVEAFTLGDPFQLSPSGGRPKKSNSLVSSSPLRPS